MSTGVFIMRHLNRYDKINLVNYYNRNEKHEKSTEQNWESNIRRTPIILGVIGSIYVCPSAIFLMQMQVTLLPVNWFSLSSKDVLSQVKS